MHDRESMPFFIRKHMQARAVQAWSDHSLILPAVFSCQLDGCLRPRMLVECARVVHTIQQHSSPGCNKLHGISGNEGLACFSLWNWESVCISCSKFLHGMDSKSFKQLNIHSLKNYCFVGQTEVNQRLSTLSGFSWRLNPPLHGYRFCWGAPWPWAVWAWKAQQLSAAKHKSFCAGKNKTIPTMQQDHPYDAARPSLWCSKTIPTMQQDHTYDAARPNCDAARPRLGLHQDHPILKEV